MEWEKIMNRIIPLLLLFLASSPAFGNDSFPTEIEIRARIEAIPEVKMAGVDAYQRAYWSLPQETEETSKRARAREMVANQAVKDTSFFYLLMQQTDSNIPGDVIDVDVEPYPANSNAKPKAERVMERLVGVGGAALLAACVVWIAARLTKSSAKPIYWGLIGIVIAAVVSAAVSPV